MVLRLQSEEAEQYRRSHRDQLGMHLVDLAEPCGPSPKGSIIS